MSPSVRRVSLALLCVVTAGLAQAAQPSAVAAAPPAVAPQAPTHDPQPVFTDASKADRARSQIKDEATTKRVRYVEADLSQFPAPERGNARRLLKLDLFDDVKHTAVLNETVEIAPGVVSWAGHLKGVPLSDANFVVQDGVLAGSVRMPGASYQIEWAGADTYSIVDFDESQLPDNHPVAKPAPAEADADAPSDAPVSAQSDDGSEIDLLIVYTDDARAAAGGTSQIRSNLQLAVANANAAYANSNVTQRVNVVHQEEINYSETGDMYRDLDRVTAKSDGFLDAVHRLRDTHHADLVSFVTDSGNACGIAWVMMQPSSWYERYGFNVVKRGCAVGGLTLAHELGHNMGLMHDRHVEPDDGAYPYGHGFVDPSTPRTWRTVMAYNDLCRPGSCTALQYFSNPDLVHQGDPMGISPDLPNSADSARALNNARSFVANFRDAPEPCTDDTLEPNDSALAATSISSGQTQTGTVCPGNHDVFSAPASAGQTFNVHLDHVHSAGDLDIVLQDAAGNELAASTSNDDDEQITYPVGSTGSYYVRVYGDNAPSNTYALSLAVTDAPVAAIPKMVVRKKGKGTVRTAEPTPLIVCGQDCGAAYAEGSIVILSAKAKRRYRFARWTGPCAEFGRRPCVLLVEGPVAIKAVFKLR